MIGRTASGLWAYFIDGGSGILCDNVHCRYFTGAAVGRSGTEPLTTSRAGLRSFTEPVCSPPKLALASAAVRGISLIFYSTSPFFLLNVTACVDERRWLFFLFVFVVVSVVVADNSRSSLPDICAHM